MPDTKLTQLFPKPVARALARWIVLLLGWVWLGAQGQRLGWAFASGVVPVALWWATRLLLAQAPILQRLSRQRLPRQYLPRSTACVLGLLTSLGTLLISVFPQSGLGALMLVALLWAAWLAVLETQAVTSQCSRRWVGWPPLLAAGLCALATAAPLSATIATAAVPLLLLLATWLGRDVPRPVSGFSNFSSHPAAVIPATAMGLMMGTLWLGSAWCSAAGWSNAHIVVLHLTFMSVLPGLTQLELLPKRLPQHMALCMPLILVIAASAALLAGTQAIHGLIGMALLSLAWAMHAGRYVQAQRANWYGAALGGPALLLLVGWLSPLLGPQALQWAYGLLGGLALIALTAIIRARNDVLQIPPVSLPLSDVA